MAAMAATPAIIGCGETIEEPVVVGTPETAIEHVVVLMLENRSFDHYLGSLSLVEGRTDIEGLTADMSNPDPEGGVVNVYH
ncbi:MAG: phospholipase C, phosphocholine-specific, partial [Deltaproteobacteria bacterium]|nr:phospholipase C, phosphocholine-specific [Deltaproteobacteria bacterium]